MILPKQRCKVCEQAPADRKDGLCSACRKALNSKEMAENFNYMSIGERYRQKWEERKDAP